MKSFKTRIVLLALTVSIAAGVIAPQKSHAYLAIGGAKEWNEWWDDNGPITNTILIGICGLTLPFCLLDQEGNEVQNSRQSLLNQGYSNAEVDHLIHDQNVLAKKLREKNYRLEVRKSDTPETLRQQILSVAPKTSDAYMEFFFEMKGLK